MDDSLSKEGGREENGSGKGSSHCIGAQKGGRRGDDGVKRTRGRGTRVFV